MKPIIICYACLLSLAISAQQAEKKYSFYFQGGYKSSLFIKEHGGHRLRSGTESHQHKCIIFNTGIQFFLRGNLRIGTSFTYDHFGTKHRSVEHSNLSYMLRCDWIWKEKNSYLLYSGLAGGLRRTRRFENEKETERMTAAAYHIYVIGAEYKIIKNLFIDANAGWGISGIVSAGAKFRF